MSFMMPDPVSLVRTYIQASTDSREPIETSLRLLHPAFRFVEKPNRVCPAGRERDLEASSHAARLGRRLVATQHFTIADLAPLGDEVVFRGVWEGVVAPGAPGLQAGATLRSHSAMFFGFADGLIARIVTYDCFEPFALGG